jgi:hypothetical protein
MCVESRGTIRADDAQILNAIVVSHAVDVIEYQRHPATVPDLILAANLTLTYL